MSFEADIAYDGSLSALPGELQNEILEYLDISDLLSLSSTNSYYRWLINPLARIPNGMRAASMLLTETPNVLSTADGSHALRALRSSQSIKDKRSCVECGLKGRYTPGNLLSLTSGLSPPLRKEDAGKTMAGMEKIVQENLERYRVKYWGSPYKPVQPRGVQAAINAVNIGSKILEYDGTRAGLRVPGGLTTIRRNMLVSASVPRDSLHPLDSPFRLEFFDIRSWLGDANGG
ncbi:hypothetical protein CPB85DRAFT_1433687 [Mucidula mucida]|nr:hypothetical protein CPB85DRAFT_1433687 [Mucidula mucida]